MQFLCYCNYCIARISPQGIGGGASRSLMDQFAEVLFALNKNCFALLTVWLKEALQSPGFPSSRVTTEQKDHFCQQILRYHDYSDIQENATNAKC